MSRLLICFAAFLALCNSYKIAPLPNYIVPKLYNLELSLQNDGNFTGVVTITLDTMSGTPRENLLLMNSEGLEIITASIKNQNGKIGYIRNYATNQTTRTVSLLLEQPLENSTSYELKISYKRNKDIKDGYGLVNHNGYLYTNLHPIYARRVLPCFDAPDKKAEISVRIDTPNSFVVSNMPLESSAVMTQGVTRYTFKRTPYIPINKLFFLTGPKAFTKYASLQWGNTSIHVYPDFQKMKFFNDIVNIANSSLLHNLWSKGGMEKLDILVVPELVEEFYSGYGVVVLRKDLMEYGLAEATTEMKREGAFKILEAILQVYYGSIVSPYIWEANWLSTSVSNYLKYLAFNKDQNWGDMNEFMLLDIHLNMVKHSGNISSDPVSYKHPTFDDTDDLIKFMKGPSVNKGSAVLSMMESFLGSKEIENFFVNFLDKYKYGTGLSEMNLFSMLTSSITQLPTAAEVFLNPWVFEPSFPVVYVAHKEQNVRIAQMSYARVQGMDQNLSWITPISYVTAQRSKFDPHNPGPIWYLAQSFAIDLNETVPQNDMIAVNIDGKSPYITHYEAENWKNLGIALRKNISVLTPSTRANLVADAFKMAKEGRANYIDILHLLTFLDDETSLAPWTLAIEGFKEMYSWIYFTQFKNSTAIPDMINLHSDFKTYVINRLVSIYDKLGFEQTGNDRENDSLRRAIVEAMCYFGYESCRTNTYEYYKKMNNTIDIYTPPNDMRPNLLCAGVRNANTQESWKQIYNSLIEPGLQSQIMDIYLDVLACSESVGETSLPIRAYLTKIFIEDDKIPVNKIRVAYKSVYSKASHVNQALYFLLDRSPIIKKIGHTMKAQLLRDIAPRLSTNYHSKLLDDFVKTHPKADQEILDAVQLAKTIIYTNQMFIKNNMDAIHDGLVTEPPGPPGPTLPPGPTISTITTTPTTPSNTTSNGTVTETPVTQPTTSAPAASGGMSAGKISLIVIGVIVGVIIIGLVLYCICKKGGCCE